MADKLLEQKLSINLNANLKSMIANVTSEMTKENDRMRQEFSTQLQADVQSIAKEVDVVTESTDMELINCVRNFESACERMNESTNAYKSQTDASVKSQVRNEPEQGGG
jgi:two-component sensor histidine kinase